MSFDDLRLAEPLLEAVRTSGYIVPTPIQTAAIPLVLEGRDLLGCAHTGTGKTAAFALPILHRLLHEPVLAVPADVPNGDTTSASPQEPHADAHNEQAAPARPGRGRRLPRGGRRRRAGAAADAPPRPVRVLVLCPTRELAQQICESFETYGQYTGVRAAVVFGGVNQGPQVRALRGGVDVLIATPGRLLDLVQQGVADIGRVEVLVLDEADRMLDMGFLPDLRRIVALVPKQRQTLLFSATMPVSIRNLAHQILRDPVPVQVAAESTAPPTIEHWVYRVETPDKVTLLARLLKSRQHTRALVFTSTKRAADDVATRLTRDGVPVVALHSNLSQGLRTQALADFRSGKTPVLVATDVAARGLDIDDVSHVYNYDLQCDAETYIHRTGRTGRAGASGVAVSLCNVEDYWRLKAIERLLKAPMRRADETMAPAVGDKLNAPAPASDGVAPRPAARTRTSWNRPLPRTTRRSVAW